MNRALLVGCLSGLVLACASSHPSTVSVTVTAHNPRIASAASLLRTVTAEAIRREDGAPRATGVTIAIESHDVVVRNQWVETALTHGAPLFGADTNLSVPPADLLLRGSITNTAGTVILGNYMVTDASGNVLASEPFNLGLLDMNHPDRKLAVLRQAGDHIATRVSQLR